MTTQPERVQLDDLTEDALAGLYDERDRIAAEVKILRARVNDQNAAADVTVSAIRLVNEAGAQRDRAEARVRGLESIIARVRRAVDTGPVGACCAHIIRAALTPPAGLCGCGRPDPGPCTPCPHRSTSLHCACVCDATANAGHSEGAAGI
ncbi:hypothetical protein ACIQH0_33380 [Streptomyces griseus]|uniref:hypothetical protein n=1 Tax=Streptomyces griseus TaxID=1911 RepID=UPI0037F5E96D